MPLRNVKGKWYWGSKGPFDTKAKALAVARAAYANGYKGEQKDEKVFLVIESRKKSG
jgi:hypothetical protein